LAISVNIFSHGVRGEFQRDIGDELAGALEGIFGLTGKGVLGIVIVNLVNIFG